MTAKREQSLLIIPIGVRWSVKMDIIIDEALSGLCIRELLQKRLGYSSNIIKKLKFSEGGILVNGRFVTVRHVLSEGEVLSLAVEDKPDDVSPYTIPVELPIAVVFEDEHVTAVNKPADMPAHPSLGHKLDTVSNALAYRYRGENYVFRPVNRLDRDTSGCMLTANSKVASYKMYKAMTEGRIRKTYLAVTDGCPGSMSGELFSYMKWEEGSIIKRVETTYEVMFTNGKNAVIKLSPITGRTHQLRVQLAGIGCPITGDDMYGEASEHIGRQALHSWKTEFPHPATDENITVTAPIHEDMRKLIGTLFGENAAFSEIL